MQLKYALLHCSYSAPVTVWDTASATVSIAALDIVDCADLALSVEEFAFLADTFVAVLVTFAALRDVVLVEVVLPLIVLFVDPLSTVVVARAEEFATGALVREINPCPEDAALREVTARPTTLFVDAVREVFTVG